MFSNAAAHQSSNRLATIRGLRRQALPQLDWRGPAARATDGGVKAAKARGVYKGRPPSIKPEAIAALKAEGLGATAIANRLGINRASVYRLLA
jgi:DNA invertase Pin-like site-specific DNA recombinase